MNWTLTYNPASQIVTDNRDNNSYAWTGAVNVNRNYAVNGLNQYTTAGSASFTYDANGNLTSDGTWTYTYDVENRLVKGVNGSTTVNLTYDPLGRLFQVDKGTAASETKFVYDGDALALEYNSSDTGGNVTNRYVHGSNVAADDPLVWYSGATLSTVRYLHADHLGSIDAIGSSAGAIYAINTYDEYGIPGSANTGRFQYTGQAYIPELGLYYYKARFYSPTTGRFLQTDPIGYKDQINLYEYVGDDPVDYNDPSGQQSCPIGAGSGQCPDVPAPARADALKTAKAAGPSREGNENGAALLRDKKTGTDRILSGKEAGTGTGREFDFAFRPKPTEQVIDLAHVHPPSDATNPLQAMRETRAQNAPSTTDQAALQGSKVPQTIVGPSATLTLYRVDMQDHVRIEAGNRNSIPDLSDQKIVVDPQQ